MLETTSYFCEVVERLGCGAASTQSGQLGLRTQPAALPMTCGQREKERDRYIYIYIYIEREREGEREPGGLRWWTRCLLARSQDQGLGLRVWGIGIEGLG